MSGPQCDTENGLARRREKVRRDIENLVLEASLNGDLRDPWIPVDPLLERLGEKDFELVLEALDDVEFCFVPGRGRCFPKLPVPDLLGQLSGFGRPSLRYERQKCGKPSCSTCQSGEGHGPYWVLYVWLNDKTRKAYIGKELAAERIADRLMGLIERVHGSVFGRRERARILEWARGVELRPEAYRGMASRYAWKLHALRLRSKELDARADELLTPSLRRRIHSAGPL